MSLDTVVEEIRDDARARAEEIRERAEAEAEDIVAEAESDADEIIEEAEQEAEREIEQLREQRLSSAKLEAKHERMRARRDALDDVRSQVEDQIASLDGDERRELTEALLDAALAEFDEGEQLAVHYAPQDAELVADLVEEYSSAEPAGEFDCLGGVVVESETSRVRVKNTFDSVLEAVWDDDLKDISDTLFEDQ
ncbi:V-type ATP synthase subunit E [Halocalculus aciditolerans]|uniref:A-type ATP synthase subunit E n=1 Tax=Halocalculus aciditolerans TaxID=1383812 RepID=A0A830F887_9EURY|nr:V-type ATP synthase subunit E [Halocalculus aciditolerans]GGL49094.1 hypothetical protein GCM10009039_04100 [Halocalculus aciditolerans]